MPMVDASTQTTPPQTPAVAAPGAWPAGALPKTPNAKAGPSKLRDAVVDEKAAPAPVRPQVVTAAPSAPAPAAPRVHIIQPPRTPCVAQPVALLGYVVGIALGVTMGLSYMGLLAHITGYGAAILAVMGLLFLAGAPPFHSTYANSNRTSG